MDHQEAQIRNLPCWKGNITVRTLPGGITNRNFLIEDASGKFVVRLGGDLSIHHVMRFNEHTASRAAAQAGVSPQVIHAEPGILVLEYIDAKPPDAVGIRSHIDEIVDLVRRVHHDVPKHLHGPVLAFWVFHVIRDYAATLGEAGYNVDLQKLLDRAQELEKAVGEVEIVFGHNDLLAGNFLNDGKKWWLIDWEYAGFNSPLFDLGGLASNNEFSEDEESHMLELYFGHAADPALWRKYQAMKAASLLREAMWSMVSEIHSKIDFDYKAYTQANLKRFEEAWTRFAEL